LVRVDCSENLTTPDLFVMVKKLDAFSGDARDDRKEEIDEGVGGSWY
jgi:hypothetical protein